MTGDDSTSFASQTRGHEVATLLFSSQFLSCSVAPCFLLFFGGCPAKMVFPKKGSFFSRVTEQLRFSIVLAKGPHFDGWRLAHARCGNELKLAHKRE